MSDLMSTLALSASGMKAQAGRLRHVSENIANSDTPGYRRKTVNFQSLVDQSGANIGVEMGKVALDQAELKQVYDPGNPLADANGYYEGSNVNLMVEIADAREAQRSYEANLKMFDQARQMQSSLLELLRR
ncbi:flagellar basal body rod protein FlgC [Candidatus Halocynthiibacter alkanivorans]|jgi:flagellar basal-body rod protein FlgC|uniref:flagellar basal body rod protein FlgC n=1 Tax=Candidatus Halocynthiibacter alkanivorans TaxID=2267619 RepID=UPI000DF38FA8|nr:flagellar basal body rod protein FlgC [Candidatus Halocynthiibacter alkanivorans]